MVKAILFDIDDTLIKTYETKKEALKDMGKRYYNVDLTDEDIKPHWGKPIKELLPILYKDLSNLEEAFERYVVLRENYPSNVYEDTLSTIKHLANKYTLGIITNKSKRYARKDFVTAGIPEELFLIIQTEEENTAHKPNPKVFDFILKRLSERGIKKNEVLYVGDTISDYLAASGAGLEFYGIPGRTTDLKKFEDNNAKTINKLSDLINLL